MNERIKRCKYEGCKNKYSSRGYCVKHHRIEFPREKCIYSGCETPRLTKGYCNKHYSRLLKHGNPGTTLIGEKGKGFIDNGYRKFIINGEKLYEHRIVMEKHIGRKLSESENVHHKNGNRLDNRLKNLEIWNTAQPCGQRPEDKIKYAIEILELYAPDKLSK